MRILVISNLFPPYHRGGYGTLCNNLAQGLAHRGHEIFVLTSKPAANQSKDPGSVSDNIWVERSLRLSIDPGPLEAVLQAHGNSATVKRAIQGFKPDLVYGFSFDGIGFASYVAATECGIPSVTVIGDTWLAQAFRDLGRYDAWTSLVSGRGRFGSIKRFLTLPSRLAGVFSGSHPPPCRPVHIISNFLHDDLAAACGMIPAQSWVMPCPLDSRFFRDDGTAIGRHGDASDALRVLFLSRVEILKGPDVAIRGISEAVRLGANVRLTIAGIDSNRLRPELELLASSLGVSDRVAWGTAAGQDELVHLYRSHDVFVFPSKIVEGLGLVNAEAMASGLPVLGTTTGGASDLIQDGITGYSIEPGDHVEYGRHLAALHADRTLLDRLSVAAMRVAERYNPKLVLEEVDMRLSEIARNE